MGAPSLQNVAEAPEDWISSVVPTFRWERRFSTVVGDAFRWIGRWIRPMTSLTRRGRIQSGSSSTMQSSQQLLWTAAPSLGPGRFRRIWVMASPVPRGHSRLAHGRSASRLQGQFGMQLRPYRAPGLGRPRWGQRSGKPVA